VIDDKNCDHSPVPINQQPEPSRQSPVARLIAMQFFLSNRIILCTFRPLSSMAIDYIITKTLKVEDT
jgi:hypothetical protein